MSVLELRGGMIGGVRRAVAAGWREAWRFRTRTSLLCREEGRLLRHSIDYLTAIHPQRAIVVEKQSIEAQQASHGKGLRLVE